MGVVCWDECELIRQMQTEMRASGRGKASERLTPHAANPTGQEQEHGQTNDDKTTNTSTTKDYNTGHKQHKQGLQHRTQTRTRTWTVRQGQGQ